MNVAVTGASGHLGANLVRALAGAGHRVRALYSSDSRALEGLAIERTRADVLDPAALAQALRGQEVVYHLAARISLAGDPGGEVRRVNVEGTANVCAACARAGVRRLVHFSSIHALRHAPWNEPLDETRPLTAEGPAYDRTKAEAERVVLGAVAGGLDAVIVNPTSVLGPFDFKPSPMGAVVLLLCQRRLAALVDAGFDWVDVRDVVEGAIAAAERGRSGERYLLGGGWRHFGELATLVAREAGVKPPRFTAPLWLAQAGAPLASAWSKAVGARPLFSKDSMSALATAHRNIVHAKAERELGFRARPLEQTVADSVRWFRDNGFLPGI